MNTITNFKDCINNLEENPVNFNLLNEEKLTEQCSESKKANTIRNDDEKNSNFRSDLQSEISTADSNPNYTAHTLIYLGEKVDLNPPSTDSEKITEIFDVLDFGPQSNINGGEEEKFPSNDNQLNSFKEPNLSDNTIEMNNREPYININHKVKVNSFLEDSSSTRKLGCVPEGKRIKNAIRNFRIKRQKFGVRGKNVIRNFGGKIFTFVNNISNKSSSKFLGDESIITFKKWIGSEINVRNEETLKKIPSREKMRKVGTLKKLLIIEKEDSKTIINFKGTLQRIMLHFVEHKFDEWIKSSNQKWFNKDTMRNYKEDLKRFITEPETF